MERWKKNDTWNDYTQRLIERLNLRQLLVSYKKTRMCVFILQLKPYFHSFFQSTSILFVFGSILRVAQVSIFLSIYLDVAKLYMIIECVSDCICLSCYTEG